MTLANDITRCSGNKVNKQLDKQCTDCIRLSNYSESENQYWQSWTLPPIKTFEEVCSLKPKNVI